MHYGENPLKKLGLDHKSNIFDIFKYQFMCNIAEVHIVISEFSVFPLVSAEE